MLYRPDPILRPMVWGSELWVLSGYAERLSVMSGGPGEGLTINQLICEQGERLVGRECLRRFGDSFPLLIKFLDVHAPLSVQVHPSEEFARERQGLHGKTEMWYVVDAQPGAGLMAGFSRSITPDEFERRIADGSITDVIARHSIAAGDVFFIPPGRVHALLPGSYIAEIQQSSDSTYRIWDYNRPGLDGKLRPLHTALAREVLDYEAHSDYRTVYEARKDAPVPLVSCDWFTTSMLDITGRYVMDLSSLDSFVVLTCVNGSGKVICGSDSAALARGGCLLVPACEDSVTFEPDGGTFKVLITHV
ncbi:MAG: class I mannose-6-phosphate isomerase [Bacteroidales bacterium]|nr:class I mannose-6-phosphate isomerase [Bacteroidales bacterium]